MPSISLRPHEGRYKLTLVATTWHFKGRRVSGTLELHATSVTDISPQTGRGPAQPDTARSPLYGWTDLDFASVGAPVIEGDSIEPSPRSRDPVRPGVLVLTQPLGPREGTILVVSTLSNLRDETGWVDGGGIGLWVRDVSDADFRGTWDNWGLLAGSEGYFCATYVGP